MPFRMNLQLNDFWSSTSLRDIDGTEKTWPLPKGKYDFNFHNSAGLRYEAEEVRNSIRSNEIQNENVTHNDSLIIAFIETEIRKQIGVVYPEDE